MLVCNEEFLKNFINLTLFGLPSPKCKVREYIENRIFLFENRAIFWFTHFFPLKRWHHQANSLKLSGLKQYQNIPKNLLRVQKTWSYIYRFSPKMVKGCKMHLIYMFFCQNIIFIIDFHCFCFNLNGFSLFPPCYPFFCRFSSLIILFCRFSSLIILFCRFSSRLSFFLPNFLPNYPFLDRFSSPLSLNPP